MPLSNNLCFIDACDVGGTALERMSVTLGKKSPLHAHNDEFRCEKVPMYCLSRPCRVAPTGKSNDPPRRSEEWNDLVLQLLACLRQRNRVDF